MQEPILVYLLFTLAVLSIIECVRKFEFQTKFRDYVYMDLDEQDYRRQKRTDWYQLFVTIVATAIPIKFQLYKGEYSLYIYLIAQTIILISSIRQTNILIKLIFTRYLMEFLLARETHKPIPCPPWIERNLSLLCTSFLLDRFFLKFMERHVKKNNSFYN